MYYIDIICFPPVALFPLFFHSFFFTPSYHCFLWFPVLGSVLLNLMQYEHILDIFIFYMYIEV